MKDFCFYIHAFIFFLSFWHRRGGGGDVQFVTRRVGRKGVDEASDDDLDGKADSGDAKSTD